ncbi:protein DETOXIFICATION 16-like isoform X2 [Rhodamnia argentea]|uniref:Protein DETOXIFICATION n=1 Tax=Rhodamnia argentea TaxID=178133 RepID=A0ABM3HC68_9MYRT|nr:protein DETOXIFICATION 16-like isoform X2 [Rhodamnia argentea]
MDVEEQKQHLESPLLTVSRDKNASASGNGFKKDEIFSEMKQQLSLAGPLVSVNLMIYCLQVISLMFVGHLGELALSGASMATSFACVTGFSMLIGMASALDTFCGQSYGAKQYHMLGIHKQRAMIVLLLASIPLATIWANAGRILLFFKQDPQISTEAGSYAQFMIPCIFAYALLHCHIRFLQTQNNVVPMMVCSGITTSLHIFICWFLVFKSGLGNKGAALANAISYWINVLLLAIYVRISPSCKRTWTGFSREAFHGIPGFLKLAIPSAVMTCFELWSFEMVVLLSGLLPKPKLEASVLSISLNTCYLVYMIPLGLSGSISTRVSNELGAGRPRAARLSICVSLMMVATEGLLAGIARGCGWQKIGAFINLGAYYLLGIPVAIFLAFVCHIGGKGLWTGIIVALVAQASLLAVLTGCTDWEKEAKKATDRVHSAVTPTVGLLS